MSLELSQYKSEVDSFVKMYIKSTRATTKKLTGKYCEKVIKGI